MTEVWFGNVEAEAIATQQALLDCGSTFLPLCAK
jgi:hypothetical protein